MSATKFLHPNPGTRSQRASVSKRKAGYQGAHGNNGIESQQMALVILKWGQKRYPLLHVNN